MAEVRKLIEDPSFPNGWPNKEKHIDHQVKWKSGVSKEYGVHGSAVGVDFDMYRRRNLHYGMSCQRLRPYGVAGRAGEDGQRSDE